MTSDRKLNHHTWEAYGKRLADFGTNTPKSLDELITSQHEIGFDIRALLVSLLCEMQRLRGDISRLPTRIARASIDAKVQSEMKLADKQRRAAEAKIAADRSMPPEITFVDMSDDDMVAAEEAGIVRRRW